MKPLTRKGGGVLRVKEEAGLSVGEEVAVERVPLMIQLPRGVARNVEDLAIDEGTSTSQMVEELLLEALVLRAGGFDS